MVELIKKKTNKQGSSEIVIGPLIIPGQSWKEVLKHKTATEMFDIKAWAEYVVEWAAKDPYGFLTTVILALTPLFLASAVLSWKLAKMIEAREKEQKKKQKRQENIAKAKRLKKD
ncbi:small integral membrane protein 15 [Meles meles]|uniref:small integral membrane protein 15 n=1 Tax=Meles meles TaxID=9662 RepID=UPI001E69D874|nr:small integral membrane protein 15 [Meles meles]XP_045855066.1 small integral membrane protein 15 [Meles meles]XP_045855067.1 small integral membrane protein 15 [Meles meles]XP_045855068.1 small integral membrane protein 15 [Meles meles]XP_045855069.1 small integral membrane protein 15 [Meles meles]